MTKESRRELSAEFLGTLILMVFGLGVNAQATLLKGEGDSNFFMVNVGWGLAVMFGVYVCANVSGAHLNPAVTLALAVRRKFSWSKVLPYILIQVLAAFVASGIVYGVYQEAIEGHEIELNEKFRMSRNIEPNETFKGTLRTDTHPKLTQATAKIFGTYPREVFYMESVIKGEKGEAGEPNKIIAEYTIPRTRQISFLTNLLDQILGTALLVLCIFALIDRKNTAPDPTLSPPIIGAIVFAIGLTFGYNCGYAINPARDFGPRLFTYFAGWGDQVFGSYGPGDWFWIIPIIGPLIGGVVGAVIYDLFVYLQHPKEGENGKPAI